MSLALLALPLVEESIVRINAFQKAKSLVVGKGIVNIGSTGNKINPLYFFTAIVGHDSDVATNVDFRNHSGFPNFVEWNLEDPLPFTDKQFDAAFCSHTLEHVANWQQLLAEMDRVADNVIVVLPHFLLLTGYFHPDHKNHFLPHQIAAMEEQYPNLKVYW